MLRRSGVGAGDAEQVGALVTKAVAFDEIQPGTTLDLTLGRRTDKSQPRPLQNMAFRARFDLKLEVARNGSSLALKQIPIAIDHTPLRVQGAIGSSLYRSARAAGAPAKAVESFIRTVATRVPVSRLARTASSTSSSNRRAPRPARSSWATSSMPASAAAIRRSS